MKLLVVEDNARLVDRIQRKLYKLYTLDFATSGHEALVQLSDIEYGVIILDLGLPDMNGLEVCRKIRTLNIQIPILILTGNDEIVSKVELLNAGADDYMTKPFNGEELKARLDSLLRRRSKKILPAIIEFADLTIDPSKRRVTRANLDIHLRRKEFDILEYLVSNNGRVLTRKMILDHVWSADSTSWVGTIDVHIKHLRDKIDKPFESRSHLIKTSYGVGYKIELPQ
jgi:two-component system OmpR family response regulator